MPTAPSFRAATSTGVSSSTTRRAILQIAATNGVHMSALVGSRGALDTKAFEVQGSASKSTAGAWAANSDARTEQDVARIEDALDTLVKLHPVTFRYTDAYRAGHAGIADQRYFNVIAQQFAEVSPDAVKGSGESLDGAARSPHNETLQFDLVAAACASDTILVERFDPEHRLAAGVDLADPLGRAGVDAA